MATGSLIVFCTHPNALEAQILAEELVSESLAACVNLLPQVTSIYRWEGEIEIDSEVVLILKTTQAAYPELEAYLKEHHPYDCPEIIASPITHGAPNYLDWLTKNTR